MTTLRPQTGAAPETDAAAGPQQPRDLTGQPPVPDPSPADPGGANGPDAELDAPAPPASLVCAAGALSGLAAAWAVSQLFRGGATAFALCGAASLLGAGATYLTYRTSRPQLYQYAITPLAALLGAVAALSTAGGRSLPSLVDEAIRGGGLAQPPIPFDPGWRFLAVTLLAAITSAGCSTAVALSRPRLAVLLPLPITLGGALIAPDSAGLLVAAVALVLSIASLGVAYGAQLAGEGVTTGGFELRRLLRGAGLTVAIVTALAGIAQAQFLFPATQQEQTVPPQKPKTPPAEPDRPLFTASGERPQGPWRLGVLDVYQDNAFLLPPIEPGRVRRVTAGEPLTQLPAKTVTISFQAADLRGQTLPAPPNPVRVATSREPLEYDPRSQVLRLAEQRVPSNYSYTVAAVPAPTAAILAAAPLPPPALLKQFAALPTLPPPGVAAILSKAPDNSFDRLQAVRDALYRNVVAAGEGRPGDVTPAKVEAMLAGGEATPYEIIAAEVMLARWAGVPARVGFGYFGGDEVQGKSARTFRPVHGAAWLEAYFEGAGWVPFLGTPPKAKASSSTADKNADPNVMASDKLALSVYVPVREQSVTLLYAYVRYWASIVLPILLLLAAALTGYPAVLKTLRARRRRKWAMATGLRARISVAYAELRDRAYDLNLGDPRHTPIEFLDVFEPDDEHEELAWLVTRALWGDLSRDLHPEDAEAAEAMASSVRRRMAQEQSPLNRLLAAVTRTSLRDPFTDEIPNLWLRRRPKRLRQAVGRAAASVRVRRLPAAQPGPAALFLAVAVLLGGCGSDRADATAPARYPEPLVPASLGGLEFRREAPVEANYGRPGRAALVSEGKVFSIREDGVAQGSVQVSLLKSDYDNRDEELQAAVERGLGGQFTTERYGLIRLRRAEFPEQLVYVRFPPERNVIQIFTLRRTFKKGPALVRALTAYQLGWPLREEFADAQVVPRTEPDPVSTSSSSSPTPATPAAVGANDPPTAQPAGLPTLRPQGVLR
jgi:transglutaminase-like putative cysteine protease